MLIYRFRLMGQEGSKTVGKVPRMSPFFYYSSYNSSYFLSGSTPHRTTKKHILSTTNVRVLHHTTTSVVGGVCLTTVSVGAPPAVAGIDRVPCSGYMYDVYRAEQGDCEGGTGKEFTAAV